MDWQAVSLFHVTFVTSAPWDWFFCLVLLWGLVLFVFVVRVLLLGSFR